MEPEDFPHENWHIQSIDPNVADFFFGWNELQTLRAIAINDANRIFMGKEIEQRHYSTDDQKYYEERLNLELESLYDKIR